MAKFLIIDDVPEDRTLLHLIINSQGNHEVLEAENGIDGLGLMRSQYPEIVFCDIKMLPMDGYMFAKAVQEIPELAGTEIIFYSAHFFDVPDPLNTAARVGVSHVILKTSEPMQMAEAVHSAITRAMHRKSQGISAGSPFGSQNAGNKDHYH